MFCPRCGTQNETGAANCLRCGSALPQPQAKTPDPPSSSPSAGGSGSAPVDQSPFGSNPSVPESPTYPGPPGQGGYGSPGGGQPGYGSPGGGSPYGSSPYGQQGYGGPGGGSPYGSPGGGQPGYGGQQGYGGPQAGGGAPYGSGPGYGGGPGYGAPPPGGGGDVPNYMGWAITSVIIGFLFCCLLGLPSGIAAIVFSNQVKQKLQTGDYAGAVEASNKAKMWCIIATIASGIGLIFNILYLASGGFR